MLLKKLFSAVKRHYQLIKSNGSVMLWTVLSRFLGFGLGLFPGVLFVVLMRILKPWILIRINQLVSPRIGHYAANTELYLCELDAGINVPNQRYFDVCYNGGIRVSNKQLGKMWARTIRLWPKWFMEPVFFLNRLFPNGKDHEVGLNSQFDRDIHNLYEKTPAHLSFTNEEEEKGKVNLEKMGIPPGAEFICLIVRDSAYLETKLPSESYNYHSYRDSSIQNYLLASEELANRGYYVIRMGEVVKSPLTSKHPKVIDYATNGMRTDFMDIYLGAKCFFCISVGTGYDAVPIIFRRPIVYVNTVPLGYIASFLKDGLCLSKKHWYPAEKKWLTLKEIFSFGIGFALHSDSYQESGVELIENSPEEIKATVLEMVDRLKGTWKSNPGDEELQSRFWKIFPTHTIGEFIKQPLHGNIRARYSTQFLKDNPEWLN